MNSRIRKVVLAVGMMAALPLFMAPCQSRLQNPPPNTRSFFGIAIALPWFKALDAEMLIDEADMPSAVEVGKGAIR